MELEQLTAEAARLGEGPCWHAEERVLYWVDILGQALHRFNPTSGEYRHWDVGDFLGTVAPGAQGGLVLALKDGLAFFDPRTESLERLPPLDAREGVRLNDGKCDPQGRLWVGSMDMEQESRPLGKLFRVDLDRSVHVMETGITVSNGLAWSPDQTTMYYIDSPTKTVVAYDFDPARGHVANKRVVIRFTDEQGYPDGMTIDAEGMLWIAHWAGRRFCRWDPVRGEVLETYATAAPNTSCCCFGGDDLRDLYVTTAREGLSPRELKDHPLSGCLFRMKTNVVVAPTYAYGG